MHRATTQSVMSGVHSSYVQQIFQSWAKDKIYVSTQPPQRAGLEAPLPQAVDEKALLKDLTPQEILERDDLLKRLYTSAQTLQQQQSQIFDFAQKLLPQLHTKVGVTKLSALVEWCEKKIASGGSRQFGR
eukprot:PhF_6_TR42797/c0_g1_i3/m.64766